jgi:hypothetical protein
MKLKSIVSILVVALLSACVAVAQEKTEQQKNAEKKQKIRTMSSQTLQELYKCIPRRSRPFRMQLDTRYSKTRVRTSCC